MSEEEMKVDVFVFLSTDSRRTLLALLYLDLGHGFVYE